MSLEDLLEAGMKDRLGQCYVLSFRFQQGNSDYDLVHGYIHNKQLNRTIDHAWVEKGDTVYDPVMDQEFPKPVYYALFNAEATKVYGDKEVNKMALKFKTYGPWHKITKVKW